MLIYVFCGSFSKMYFTLKVETTLNLFKQMFYKTLHTILLLIYLKTNLNMNRVDANLTFYINKVSALVQTLFFNIGSYKIKQSILLTKNND